MVAKGKEKLYNLCHGFRNGLWKGAVLYNDNSSYHSALNFGSKIKNLKTPLKKIKNQKLLR